MNTKLTEPKERWWKPKRQTVVIVLAAACVIALLAGLTYGGRDSSGDAAGQGLASAFEAAFFTLGACLVVLVALIAWLRQYFRFRTIMVIVVGLVLLAFIALIG